ncbi:MAG: ABC transporter permease, partial [Thermoplasmata archaeon]|nr:ABC transporter permease [Thermoplasmata archaeon]
MIRETVALTRRELLRITRNPQAIITSLLLPILYLVLFGQAFNLENLGSGKIPQAYFLTAFRGAPSYFSYFSAGMTGFVAVTATLFIGANVIFDRLFGVLKRTSATPATPTSIFGSRLIAGSIQPIALAFLVLGLSILLGHLGLSGLDITASV